MQISAPPPTIDSACRGQGARGRFGHLYLSFSTSRIDRGVTDGHSLAAAIGASVVLCALLLAVQNFAPYRAATGEDSGGGEPHGGRRAGSRELDDRAKDEIGALAHAFNVMVSEQNRLSSEHERLVLTERERLERLVSERTQTLEQSREMFNSLRRAPRPSHLLWISLAATSPTSAPKPLWMPECRRISRMNLGRWRR